MQQQDNARAVRTTTRHQLGRHALAALALGLLTACGTVPAPSSTNQNQNLTQATLMKEFAPGGTLRAAINLGNPILANKDPVTGEPVGVSVDLARELAKRLGLPLQLVIYNAAGKVTEGVLSQQWDIGFVAIDPERGRDMDYSGPYVIIEGAYMVPQASPIRVNADVDQPANRIVVGKGSAYDLYLTRTIRHAQIVRAPTSPAVTDTMLGQKYEVAAGVRQQLEADAKRLPGLRILDGRFMVINQAMAVPKNRPAAQKYLTAFVEEMKASGFVGEALKRHRIQGAAVAEPGPARAN
jgi:polar amino acid transport system substrate-binding protein